MKNLFKSKKTKELERKIANLEAMVKNRDIVIGDLQYQRNKLREENKELKETGFELQKENKELYDLYAPLRDEEEKKITELKIDRLEQAIPLKPYKKVHKKAKKETK